jgi:hypothetical protein
VVNWTKRVEKAAQGTLRNDETILAGTKLTQEQFRVAGGRTTGGFIAGGIVGAAAGAAWDKRTEAKLEAAEAARLKDAAEELPPRPVEFPRNGAIAGVTSRRILFFAASELGKAKDLFYEVPVSDIRAIHERDAEQKLLRGTPPSRAVILEFTDGTALPMWGLTGPGNAKWLDGFTAAVRRVAGI